MIQCYTEEVIDEMTQEITMATVPQALEMHREMHGGGALALQVRLQSLFAPIK